MDNIPVSVIFFYFSCINVKAGFYFFELILNYFIWDLSSLWINLLITVWFLKTKTVIFTHARSKAHSAAKLTAATSKVSDWLANSC